MKIAEYEVVGKRRYSFEGKADGKRISGVTLYCVFKDDRIEGSGVEVISISENKLVSPLFLFFPAYHTYYNKELLYPL